MSNKTEYIKLFEYLFCIVCFTANQQYNDVKDNPSVYQD